MEGNMRLFFVCILIGMLSGCSGPYNSSDKDLKAKAEAHQIVWDNTNRHPELVKGNAGVYLRPCNMDDPEHQSLFIELYTNTQSIKGYLDSKTKTKAEALALLKNHSDRWKQGNFLSGFVGYTADNQPFMHGGIGVFPSTNVAELFLIELPEFRNKGFGKKAMIALERWSEFLSEIEIIETNKIHTLICRVSPDNIAAIKLLMASGFKYSVAAEEFKEKIKAPIPSHVRLTYQTIKVDENAYNMVVMSTSRRPDPKVIFLKRIGLSNQK